MAGSAIPGPLGLGPNRQTIDAGTSAKTASPLPGPIGLDAGSAPSAASAGGAGAGEHDAEIEALDLAATARTAAYALKKAHPSIRFTSGRRSKEDQARAMASNVVKNRKWIEQTFAS